MINQLRNIKGKMPQEPDTRKICSPCSYVEDRIVSVQAKNFAYEHIPTEMHNRNMVKFKKLFPKFDPDTLFITLTKKEFDLEVADKKRLQPQGLKRARLTNLKTEILENKESALLKKFKNTFITDEQIDDNIKNRDPRKSGAIFIEHDSFKALMGVTKGFRRGELKTGWATDKNLKVASDRGLKKNTFWGKNTLFGAKTRKKTLFGFFHPLT